MSAVETEAKVTTSNEASNILEIKDLVKHFPLRRRLRQVIKGDRPSVKAVDGISFNLQQGEILGLVGESGCGKTTTGRVVLRLEEPTSGEMIYEGIPYNSLKPKDMNRLRRHMQIVFQDPYESMNPRMDLKHIISEPLRIQKLSKTKEINERVVKALEDVELTPIREFLYRYPHELSGGQRQRAAIARALVLDPSFIVADEPVSMLDVSIRGGIINVLLNMVHERGVSLMFITHDLALARHVCDRISVMYLGQIVEEAESGDLVHKPHHPYTKALIDAVLSPDPRKKSIKPGLKGEIPNPVNPPSGCRLHPRCPYATEICVKKIPEMVEYEKGHKASCHHVEKTLKMA